MMFIGLGAVPSSIARFSNQTFQTAQAQIQVPAFCSDPTQAANSECIGLVDCTNAIYAANPVCVQKLGIDCSQSANSTNPACQYVDCTNSANTENPACVGQIDCTNPYFAAFPACASMTGGTGSTSTVDCTQAANASNPACVEICGIDPAACMETAVVASDCSNPANATNPACQPAVTSSIPSWVWLLGIGIVGLLIYKHHKNSQVATSKTT